MEAPARWEPRPCVQTGGPSELGEQISRVKGMFLKSASFKPGGQQTPPPLATACSIAARSGCELALGERLSAEEAVAEAVRAVPFGR